MHKTASVKSESRVNDSMKNRKTVLKEVVFEDDKSESDNHNKDPPSVSGNSSWESTIEQAVKSLEMPSRENSSVPLMDSGVMTAKESLREELNSQPKFVANHI